MFRSLQLKTMVATFLACVLTAAPAWAGKRDVILFQPGQSSWEWLLVPATHDGGKRMREGKTCLFCHDGEEKTIGALIASGEKIEPAPIANMPGFVEMNVEASYDEQNLYLVIRWTSPAMFSPVNPDEADIHLTVMLGSPALSVAAIAGCWAACHSDLPEMPDAQAGQDLTKYLPGSRNKMTRTGGGTDIKPEADLAAQLDQGQTLEFWQVVLDQGKLKAVRDGYFLQERIRNPDSAVTATVTADGQSWTVEMVRPLHPEGASRHPLDEGIDYTLAIALHENHAAGRHHYTSFPMRFVLGSGEAEISATRK